MNDFLGSVQKIQTKNEAECESFFELAVHWAQWEMSVPNRTFLYAVLALAEALRSDR
jgi:hypothetical protein